METPKDGSLQERLHRGSELYNNRRWRSGRAWRYVRRTTTLYPEHAEAWVQAFMFALRRYGYYYALGCMAGAMSCPDFTPEQHVGIHRDLAIDALQVSARVLAENHLKLAKQLLQSGGITDPNQELCLRFIEERFNFAFGWSSEKKLACQRLQVVCREFAVLEMEGRVNRQWMFNACMHLLRMASAVGDRDSVQHARFYLWNDSTRCTWKKRLAIRLLSIRFVGVLASILTDH